MSHGLDLQKELQDQEPRDWVFGSSSVVCLAAIQEDERENYLPPGELQYGSEDFMSCATLAPINILESKFNFLYKNNFISPENVQFLKDNGYIDNGHIQFSNRFNAIKSGTTRTGNSLKAPLHSIKNDGLIPKRLLAADQYMSFDEYHNEKDISSFMERLGKEFARRFTIRYEKVYRSDFPILLDEDSVDVAGYAWPQPVEGVYPKTTMNPNHAFMIFKKQYFAFDNYIDSVDGDFVKHLASDYNLLDYGYRVYIESQNVTQTLWQRFFQWLLSLFQV